MKDKIQRFAHVSSDIYYLPEAGIDPNVDALIASGQLIVTGIGTRRDGTAVRFARSKGQTYHRPPKGAI